MSQQPTTHLIIARDARGADVVETPVGLSLKDAVGFLATAQLQPWRTLEAVYAVTLGAVTLDVTAAVLSEVATYCEADESEVPENLHAAFEAAGVPLPVQPPADWADANAEHLLGFLDLGLSRKAA